VKTFDYGVRVRVLGVVLLFGVAGCKEKAPAAPAEPPRVEADVKPAFDGAPREVPPAVAALCGALHQMPAERRAACCRGSPAQHFGGECARVLALALEQGTVELERADACVKDLVALHQGCGWVGPNEVALPESCAGVVVGRMAQGKKCRSSLECVAGLRCLGAGPTAAGTCEKPGADGMACELSVDVLVSYARQPLPPHTECAGYCQRHRCEAVLSDGGACTLDAQCPAGQRCAGTCVDGARGAAGDRCVPGGCAAGLRCIGGVCDAPKAEGAECGQDVECQGACLAVDGGGSKRCGPAC